MSLQLDVNVLIKTKRNGLIDMQDKHTANTYIEVTVFIFFSTTTLPPT